MKSELNQLKRSTRAGELEKMELQQKFDDELMTSATIKSQLMEQKDKFEQTEASINELKHNLSRVTTEKYVQQTLLYQLNCVYWSSHICLSVSIYM
jgi:septal ring factor EnvC (AmiA/AmiB activator)